MKRRILATMGVAAVLIVGGLSANADMVLTLDTAGGATPEVIIADGEAAFFVTASGLVTTEADSDGLANGIIVFADSLGAFSILVTTGLSAPAIGPNRIDLFDLSVTSTGPGTIDIGLTDTGFLGPAFGLAPLPWHTESSIGGTTDGTVLAGFFADAGDVEFGTAFGPAATLFTTSSFSADDKFDLFSPTGLGDPFSLSVFATVTHTAGGQVSSFDHILEMVPEPGTTLLGIIGLGALGLLRRRLS